jgi:solute carrier family 66 (lysosomal lysine-arginine transporter), member 1
MVIAAGVLGWFVGEKATEGDSRSSSGGEPLEFDVLGQVFGWLCAVAYIASRLPQLILNWRRKTTEGLSMLFFLFACLGNITYVLSIFAYEPKCGDEACDPGEAGRRYGKYMLVNLSWLAGALVTLFLDLGVFAQYFIYSRAADDDQDYHEYDHEEDPQSADRENWDHRPLLARGDSR